MTDRAYLNHRPPSTRLRIARKRLDAYGEVSPELIGEDLARSWGRCLEGGLPVQGRTQGGPHASAAQCARAVEQSEDLLRHAEPVMQALRPHVQGSGSLLLLADAQGMVLRSLGDDGFATRAQRVALRPGAFWSEPVRGTNAIGTALADQRPVSVHATEHYLARNGFLSCSACPIVDSQGRVIGALDISGDHRALPVAALPSTLGLVCMAVRDIERSLFEARHAGDLRVRLHRERAGLGTAAQASLALGDDGRWRGSDSVAREMFGVSAMQRESGPGAVALPGLPVDDWQAWAGDGRPHEIEIDGLGRWWVVCEAPQRAATAGRGGSQAPGREQDAPPPHVDEARARRAVFVRARALLDDAGLVLVRASPDAELQAFAAALHRSGPRARGPLREVAARTLVTAAAWARVLRSLAGGTLLLTGVELLPLPAQAALVSTLSAERDFDLLAAHAAGLGSGVLAGRFRVDLHEQLQAQALG